MRFESGEVLKMSDKICEILKDESHVWVVLKGTILTLCLNQLGFSEDLEALGIDSMRNSFAAPKAFTIENENIIKNSSSHDFRIRPQSSVPGFRKK